MDVGLDVEGAVLVGVSKLNGCEFDVLVTETTRNCVRIHTWAMLMCPFTKVIYKTWNQKYPSTYHAQ